MDEIVIYENDWGELRVSGRLKTPAGSGPRHLAIHPAHPELPQSVLFNLEEDPYETTDVSGLHPGITARLLKEMTARLERERAAYPVDFEGRPIPPRP